MRRRTFITLLGSTAASWPLAAHAQQAERMRRVGILLATAEDDAEGRDRVAATISSRWRLIHGQRSLLPSLPDYFTLLPCDSSNLA